MDPGVSKNLFKSMESNVRFGRTISTPEVTEDKSLDNLSEQLQNSVISEANGDDPKHVARKLNRTR